MPVTKRTRFEVLRRDGHRCRYCGAGADQSALTIDHVLPVALGGTDDPGNLVAACAPCNSGKTSSSPDAALVAQVDDDAIRWRQAMAAARSGFVQRTQARDEYLSRFLDAWADWDEKHALLGDDWRSAVTRWHDDGLPHQALAQAVDIAMGARVPGSRVFKYLCGVIRNMLAEMEREARQVFDASLSRDPAPKGMEIDQRTRAANADALILSYVIDGPVATNAVAGAAFGWAA